MPDPLIIAGSTLITAVGITSIWLIGYARWRRLGWKLGLLNQFIWLIYAGLTAQYGFIVGALFAASGYINALWLRHEPAATTVNDELLLACEELITAMVQLGKEHHREVVRAQTAITVARHH